MQIIIKPGGVFIGIYSDSFEYKNFGNPEIRRASHVEPNELGQWTADLSPVDGPVLGPFEKRSDAIDAELNYLNLLLSECDVIDEHISF